MHDAVAGHQPLGPPVGLRQPVLQLVQLVELRRLRPVAPPLRGHRRGDVQDQRQVRAARVAVDRLEPAQHVAALLRGGGALVRQAGEVVAVRDHRDAVQQVRQNLRLQVVQAVGGEQQRHRLPARGAPPVDPRHHQAMRQRLADQEPDGPRGRLPRGQRRKPAPLEPLAELLHLRRRPCAVDPLDDDEMTLDHGGGRVSSPSTALSMRRVLPTLAAMATSTRSPGDMSPSRMESVSGSATLT